MSNPSALFGLDNEYRDALAFIKEHPTIKYGDFDRYIAENLRLFDVPKDTAIEVIEETLDKIIAALPAIKRIASKPIVHLKDVYELSPIETVRKINNYTLAHASIHSELWSDVGKDGIKPKKLMTLEKTENYAIYENIVFARSIDAILAYTRKMLIFLNDIMYSCRDLHFNMLDRTHHSLYFLAIGKLHIEYATAQSEQRSLYSTSIDKLLYIDKMLRSKMSSEVYKKCKKHKQKLTLKKTNTFRSHKDYKQLYKLMKNLDMSIDAVREEATDDGASHDEYRAYGLLLSLFSAQHFNFSMPASTEISFDSFKADMKFKDWRLTLKAVKNRKVEGLNFIFKKDKEYRICLLFSEKNEITPRGFEAFKKSAKADEYLFANPRAYGQEGNLYLSLYDVDSFRRIQQLILRGMIYSDETFKTCAFCGNPMTVSSKGYECDVCRARIDEYVCPNTNEKYFVSDIKRLRSELEASRAYVESHRFLHDRITEARLHFRNITDLSHTGDMVCPRCHKLHY